MGLILSVDIGTTNIKAALVGEDGRLLGPPEQAAMNIESDATGRAEHDPAKLAADLFAVCRRAIGGRGSQIEGLALTTYMFGLILLDRSGRPLTKMTTFADTTAQAHYPDFLVALGDVDAMYRRTGCPPVFQYPIARLHYLSARRPALRDETRHVLDSKAFVLRLLTGECCTDYGTANSMGGLGTDGAWDETLITLSGFPPECFPRVVDGFSEKIPLQDSVCEALGIRRGTPVNVGLYDGAALAAAASGFEAGVGIGNFGTSGMFRAPTPAPVPDLEAGLINSCLLKPGLFFCGSGVNNCTIATNWLLKILGQDFSLISNENLSIPGSNGVMSFPYFTGERDRSIGNIGTGVVLGLRLASTREDLTRSFLEGVAFSYLFVKQRLDTRIGTRELRLGGGGAANRAWMQILADVLDLPIRLAGNPEMGIIGAASVARYGSSDGLLENSRRIMRDATLIEPDGRNVAIYREIAENYFVVRCSLNAPLRARQRGVRAPVKHES